MVAQQMLESPRLASLQYALASGNTAELFAFWQGISEHGAPLIEAIEGDDKHALVTFLWREKGDTHNVVIWGGPAGLDHPEDHQMTRLLDTDLWYKMYRLQMDLRGVYTFSINDSFTDQESGGFGTRFIPDPLNPKQYVAHKDEGRPDSQEVVFSILELPNAPAQTWIVPHPDGAKGKLHAHRLRSQILNNERRIWVYTPANYTERSEPYRLLLLFDGWTYIDLIPTPTILDNLVRERKIPPLVTVLLDNPDGETRNRELPCHQPLVDFLTRELMPWVHEHYHVTAEPAQTIVGGCSYGGLAAAFVGLRASETFGNVLSQSGSFWWNKDSEDDIQQEWIIQQFIASPRLPLRFYLEVGLKEDLGWIYMVGCNRHLRDVLNLKGYEVHYAEFNGYHHNVSHRGSLADGLVALMGKSTNSGQLPLMSRFSRVNSLISGFQR
jgi:enterochelin esterase family protein